jgi:hypothetical protein
MENTEIFDIYVINLDKDVNRLALQTFIETSTKEYGLIKEDDAEPCFQDWNTKINESIQIWDDQTKSNNRK